jgi:hypothetical protein
LQSTAPTRRTDEQTETDTEETDTGEPAQTAGSWVMRCQRQFSPADTRLTNLVDDANEAMPNPTGSDPTE